MKQGQVALHVKQEVMCLKNVLNSPWVSDEYIVLHTPFLRPSSPKQQSQCSVPARVPSQTAYNFFGVLIKVHCRRDSLQTPGLNLSLLILLLPSFSRFRARWAQPSGGYFRHLRALGQRITIACRLSPDRVPGLLISRIACESSQPVPPACLDSTATAWLHGLVHGVGASHVICSLRTTHMKLIVREELVASVVAGAIVVI